MVEVVETLLMLDLLIAAKVPILPGPAEEMHGVSSCDFLNGKIKWFVKQLFSSAVTPA